MLHDLRGPSPQPSPTGSFFITLLGARGGRYQVVVRPPEGAYCRSSFPVTAREILERLLDVDCHP